MVHGHQIALSSLIIFLLSNQIIFTSDGSDPTQTDPIGFPGFDDPIVIEGDSDFTAENGVSSGSGTKSDPYVIENRTIISEDIGGIVIRNTTSHLIIRNCTIYNYSAPQTIISGIILYNSSNISVNTCDLYHNYMNIYIYKSENIEVTNSTVRNSTEGIIVDRSYDISIIFNNFYNNSYNSCSLADSNYILIKNNSYRYNVYGILIESVYNLTIQNNSFTNNEGGIVSSYVSNGVIKGNRLHNNFDVGFELNCWTENLIFSHNNITNNRYGIRISDHSHNNFSISFNNISYNKLIGISSKGSSLSINDNIIMYNNYTGINSAVYSSNVEINRNLLKSNGHHGLFLIYSTHYSISNNNIENNPIGIYLRDGYRNNIHYNNINSNSRNGFEIVGYSQGNLISDNVFSNNNEYGIKLDSNNGRDLVTNNFFKQNGMGVYCSSYKTDIFNNSFENNTGYHIEFDDSHLNYVYNNTFGNGIDLFKIDDSKLYFYNNIFESVVIAWANDNEIHWNTDKKKMINIVGGEYIGGNYWSNYLGEDVNGDGLGDTKLPHGPGDMAPLVKEYPPPDLEPPTLVEVSRDPLRTGEESRITYQISDNRRIYGIRSNITYRYWEIDKEYEDMELKKFEIDDVEIDDEGIFNITIDVPSYTRFIVVDINITDLGDNTNSYSFNYSVEDVIPPVIDQEYTSEEAQTGENYTIWMILHENTGIVESYAEYYFDSDRDQIQRAFSEFQFCIGRRFYINISVAEYSSQLNYRIHAIDRGDNDIKYDWVEVAVVDVIPPTVREIDMEELRNGEENTITFEIKDNIAVVDLRINLTMDDDLHSGIFNHSITDEIFVARFTIPPDVEELTYNITIWDYAENRCFLENTISVMDTDPPEITDMSYGNPLTDSDYTLKFEITDNKGLKTGFLEYWFDNGSHENITKITNRYIIDLVPNDSYYLYYRVGAKDIHNNWMILDFEKMVIDGTDPTVRIMEGTPYTSGDFNVRLEMDDNREIARSEMKYSLNDDDGQKIMFDLDDGLFGMEIPKDAYSITLYATVWDMQKNFASDVLELSVQDGTPPEIFRPNIINTSHKRITLRVEVKDNRDLESVWVVIDWDERYSNITLEKSGEDHYQTTIELPAMEIIYRIGATDSSNNSAISDQYEFEAPPSPDNGESPVLIIIISAFVVVLIASILVIITILMIRKNREAEPEDIHTLMEIFNNFGIGTSREGMDCYEILGVDRKANDKEIRKKYRKLATLHHPDRFGNGETVSEEMVRLNCAKEILLDKEKRRILDRFLKGR